ncbi:DUF2752 domain-containing protein [Pontibacter sp. CAU 1760]
MAPYRKQKQHLIPCPTHAPLLANNMPEVAAWLLGLSSLALLDPAGDHLFSFCPFSWVWPSGCWGCGLGHGVAYLFRGDWQAAWEAHPLALPAVLLLLWRCGRLLIGQR